MGLLIETTDFANGTYKIPQTTISDLGTFITEFEKDYLRKLLGVELFELFEADVASHVPATQRFLDIYNPIREDYGSEPVINRGMKEMIKGLIYWKYMRELGIVVTQSGFGRSESDVNPNVGISQSGLIRKQNEACNDADVIQWYISKNLTTYPEYAGICIPRATWM